MMAEFTGLVDISQVENPGNHNANGYVCENAEYISRLHCQIMLGASTK